jgi:2-haloacid dehalogenase
VAIRAVIFDVYGTLFDVYSVFSLAERLYPGQGQALAQVWRERQIDYTRVRTLSGRYESFSRVTEDALVFALAKLGLASDATIRAQMMEQYAHLEAFPENRDALQELKARGLPLGVLSNGDSGMLQRLLKNSPLAGLFDHVLSAETTRRYKTAPETYQLGPDAFGMPVQDMLFVSSNGWDACGATWFGYRTFWINRAAQPAEQLGVLPSATGSTMWDVIDYI